jgi:glutaredoxin
MTYTVYGKTGCSPCQTAKDLLTQAGKPFEYVNVMTLSPNVLDHFCDTHRGVPQIYLGDEHIGGLQELKEHLVNQNKP